MAKKVYEVVGTTTIVVLKRVKALNEYEAMELAEAHFKGLECYCGNGGWDKLIGVSEESESVEVNGDYVEWREAYETDSCDYDEETDDECEYKCTICGETFYCEGDDDFDNVVEELWNHLEMEHEDAFQECEDWNDSDMIEEFFEREDF